MSIKKKRWMNTFMSVPDTRNVNGQAFGTMLLGLPEDPAEAAKAVSYIKNQPNVTMEEVRDYHV